MNLEKNSLKRTSNQIRQTFECLRVSLDLTHHQWQDILQFTPNQYHKFMNGEFETSVFTIAQVAKFCNLTIESLLTNNIDYRALAEQLKGNTSYIPEKYLVAPFSKHLSIINGLDYIRTFLGWEPYHFAMKRLQLTEAALAKPDAPINIVALTDLWDILATRGFHQNGFHAIGLYSFEINKTSELSKKLSQFESPKEIYEIMTTDFFKYFENNCSYKLLQLSKYDCLIEAHQNNEIAHSLKMKHFGSTNICTVRGGIIATLPRYIGLPIAQIKEVKCIHRGDGECLYKIDYEHATRVHSQQA